MDHPTPYDDDAYAWAYEQATLLRELAATRRDLPNALDVENLSEEIEGLARTDLREAESFMRVVLVHLLKIASAPGAPAVDHWTVEVVIFQSDFVTLLTPTILRKIEADKVWRLAVHQASAQLALDGDQILAGLPRACPISAQDLATDPFDVDAPVRRVRDSAAPQLPS